MFVQLEGDGHLSQRLYRGLRRAILEGRLTPGTRLPSTRTLASHLSLSRNVVVEAFQQLLGEGYVEARTGSGTYVAGTVPDALLAPWKPRIRTAAPPSRPPVLSPRARDVVALKPWPPPANPVRTRLRYDFHYGVPALADFPHREWSRIVARRARGISLATLQYGATLGYGPLRTAVAGYVARSRGVVATPDRVIITNGIQQGLHLIAQLLVKPGDGVIVEEPCYQAARQVFQAGGAHLLALSVDAHGLETARLPADPSVRVAYVTPSHQFPLGGILSLKRRLELLRWAERSAAYVVEDDYDSEFQYEGRPVEAVQGLDRADRVLYLGTFSKVLCPSLRLGYLIVPRPLVPTIAALKFLVDCHTPTFEQTVLTDFIEEGHFERHLRRSRERNKARRAALIRALHELGDSVEIVGESAGVHVVVWLRRVASRTLEALVSRAAARGLGLYSVAPYYLHRPRHAGLLLGYANLNERDIRDGVALLADVLRDGGATRRGGAAS